MELKATTIKNIRACLISVKGKLGLTQLNKDYKMIVGESVPFKRLGFNTLEDFLKSESSFHVGRGPDGSLVVDAKATEKTAHIAELVNRQKASKKKPKYASQKYYKYEPQYRASGPNKWRPKNVSQKWKVNYEVSPRMAAKSHNQFVNSPSPVRNVQTRLKTAVLQNNNSANIQNREVENSKPAVSRKIYEDAPPPHKPLLKRDASFDVDKTPNSQKTNRNSLMRNNSLPGTTTTTTATTFSPLRSPSLPSGQIKSAPEPVIDHNTSWRQPLSIINSESESENESKVAVFIPVGDELVDLFNFVKYHKLEEPLFKSRRRQSKPHKPVFFDLVVKIGQHSYSSYPKDFTDENACKYFLAKMALEGLLQIYGRKRRSSLLLSNETDILDRIPPMVKKHFHGIWSTQLEADYRDTYGEQLPVNWLHIIDMCPVMSVECFDSKHVLRYCNPEDKGKLLSLPLLYDISIPASTVNFDENGFLWAEVTCAVSAKEIWCRQLFTAEQESFVAMYTKLESTYADNYNKDRSKKATIINAGSYYVAWADDCWNRVRVLEVEDDYVQCLLVDRGDDQRVLKENVFELEREFAKEQAQAFICRLAGLEELYEVSESSDHLQNLETYEYVQLENVTEEDEDDKYSQMVSVVIYDKDGKSLNAELTSLISIEKALPVIEENSTCEVFLSNVESNGDIYVQIHSLGYQQLETFLNDLETSILEKEPKITNGTVTSRNSKDRLYFTKLPQDEHYARVKIIDWAPNELFAQLYYIDIGKTAVVKVKDTKLYPLDEISTVASRYPEQALKLQLAVPLVDDFVKKIWSLAEHNKNMLVRLVDKDPNSEVPRVKLFVRQKVGLVSVNDSLVVQNQNKEKETHATKLEKILTLDSECSKNNPSSGMLKSPKLPQIGDYYDVSIPTAVNPWNFFIQPYESYEQRKKLMERLQTRYTASQYSPLRLEDIMPGQIYASKHEDGIWYRTSVIKVIHSGSISVFYCDFGYYATLRQQQLLPLDPEFLELPYQAIKAKLSGIKPKQAKWTMDDCKFFEKLVRQKNFVSVPSSIEKDELYRCDTVICLKLVDTSTDKDVDIEDILIRKHIAVRVSTI